MNSKAFFNAFWLEIQKCFLVRNSKMLIDWNSVFSESGSGSAFAKAFLLLFSYVQKSKYKYPIQALKCISFNILLMKWIGSRQF